MRSNTFWIAVVALLLIVIAVMAWFLFTTPAPISVTNVATTTPSVPASPSQTTNAAAPSTAPLSASVTVSTPASGASVGQTFAVAGIAPNGWYDEAVFPIQVRDPDDNLIATAQGHAQSDWTTPGPVPFTASVTIQGGYTGPATLILLRDNPSGLPQNEDLVSIPVVIQ